MMKIRNEAGRAQAALFSAFLAASPAFSFLDDPKYCLFPGFCDVHVHFREPGFSYKETVATGRAAAARGGYTDVCTMPNLRPVPDSLPHLREVLAPIEASGGVAVHPYGALTVDEAGRKAADLDAMAPYVVAFSDDGRGVQDETMMKTLLLRAKGLHKLVAAHCEDESLVHGGYLHEGVYAAAHGHPGILSESEWRQVARDLALAEETGAAYHVCHVSTKESVALLRHAKARGVDVSCETAPHYLVFCDEDVQEDGRFRMNPPLRGREDRAALIAGVLDGTIDMIATDHAPHTPEEKSRGLAGSPFGVVGLETAFAALNTALVRTGKLSMAALVSLLAGRPRRRFGLADNGFAVFCPEEAFVVDPAAFASQGRATPFAGMTLYGVNYLTVDNAGRLLYRKV